MFEGYHFGRSWVGHPLEDDCPCEKAMCGLVVSYAEECDQHNPETCKTIRQSHPANACPAPTEGSESHPEFSKFMARALENPETKAAFDAAEARADAIQEGRDD